MKELVKGLLKGQEERRADEETAAGERDHPRDASGRLR